jgi:hypothetical protein
MVLRVGGCETTETGVPIISPTDMESATSLTAFTASSSVVMLMAEPVPLVVATVIVSCTDPALASSVTSDGCTPYCVANCDLRASLCDK